MTEMEPFSWTVFALFLTLACLVILLIFLYKKLKKESDGEYSIRRMVYKKGGVRDQVRGAALALETRLGIQLWPRSDSEDDGQEMQDARDVEAAGSGAEEDEEQGEEEEGNSNSCERESADGGSCEEESEGRAMPMDEPMTHKEKKVEESEDQQDNVKGTQLLIDLNNLSGSAIWSEEQGCVDTSATVTTF